MSSARSRLRYARFVASLILSCFAELVVVDAFFTINCLSRRKNADHIRAWLNKNNQEQHEAFCHSNHLEALLAQYFHVVVVAHHMIWVVEICAAVVKETPWSF
jgi:hypothetical protein